jgi:uncharacterized membrane protein YagU involved in acid resistance
LRAASGPAALVVYGFFGLKPMRLLQGICQRIAWAECFNGGVAVALLGLLCHFVIAFGAAAIYVFASRAIPSLIQHAFVSGVLYGVAVYFFMNRIVLPLRCRPSAFFLQLMVVGVVIHIFCVGLPISLIVRRFSR